MGHPVERQFSPGRHSQEKKTLQWQPRIVQCSHICLYMVVRVLPMFGTFAWPCFGSCLPTFKINILHWECTYKYHHPYFRLPSPLLVARVPPGDGVSGGARLGLQGRSQPCALAHGLQEGDQGGGGRPQEPHSSQGRHHRRRPLQADQGEWCSGYRALSLGTIC